MTTPAPDPKTEGFKERARQGLRNALRRSASNLGDASYPALVAALCAGACAPVAAAALGTGVSVAAAIGLVGGVGTNILSRVVDDCVGRLKRGCSDGEPSEADIRAALESSVAELVQHQSEHADQLADELRSLMVEIGDLREVVQIAVQTGDDRLATLIEDRFSTNDADHGEIKELLRDLIDQYWDLSTNQRHIVDLLTELLGAKQRIVQRWKGNPYLGLKQFEEDHAKIFFGREELARSLADEARGCLADGRVLMVMGASGTGKSSLLRAGLMRACGKGELAAGSDAWPRRAIRPRSQPLDSLLAVIAGLGGIGINDLDQARVNDRERFVALVRAAVLAHSGNNESARLLLVVDQFEELFTKTSDRSTQRDFIEALATPGTGPDAPALVVLGMRGDFYDHCTEFDALTEPLKRSFPVGSMNRREMRQAIIRPAQVAGGSVSPQLADLILDDFAERGETDRFTPGALPLLSETMSRLWEQSTGGTITPESYNAIGGVTDAVANEANRVYNRHQNNANLVRDLFIRLTAFTEDGLVIRATENRETLVKDFGSEVDEVINDFADERFLVVNTTSGDDDNQEVKRRSTVEIAHECLFTQWRLLADWIEKDRVSLSRLNQVNADATAWKDKAQEVRDRPSAFLYQGEKLQETETERRTKWDPDRRFRLGEAADEFLKASRRHATRRRRVRHSVTAVLAGLVVIATVMLLMVLNANSELIEQRNRVLSQQLVEESAALHGTDGRLAQLLAAAAWELNETDEASAALTHAIGDASAGEVVSDPVDGVKALSPNVDGTKLATIGASGLVRIWSTRDWTYQELPVEVSSPYLTTSPTFSPDGRVLAVMTASGVVLWDTATSRTVITIEAVDVEAVAFSPDGTNLAVLQRTVTYGADGPALTSEWETVSSVWDLARGEEITRHDELTGWSTIEFSADGSTVYAADLDGILWEWTIDSGAMVFESPFGGGDVQDLWLSDDDQLFACGPQQCFARNSDREWTTVSAHTNGQLVTITPDGKAVISPSARTTASVVDLRQGTVAAYPTQGHSDTYMTILPETSKLVLGTDQGMQLLDFDRVDPLQAPEMSWASDSDLIDVAEDTNRFMILRNLNEVEVWETADWQSEPARLLTSVTATDLTEGAISPDGLVFAINEFVGEGADDRLRLFDAATGAELPFPRNGHRMITEILFSPDGSHMAVLAGDGPPGEVVTYELLVWDIAAGEVVLQVDATAGNETHFAFVPQKAQVALIDAEGSIAIWDYRESELVDSITIGASQPDAFAFTSDGSRVGVATPTGLTTVWNIEAGEAETYETGRIFGGFEFTPDGRYIVSIGADGMSFWDTERRQQAAVLPVTNSVNYAEFLSNSWRIVVGSDGQLLVLDASTLNNPLATVCDQAGTGLTKEEWETYIPELEFGEIPVCQ